MTAPRHRVAAVGYTPRMNEPALAIEHLSLHLGGRRIIDDLSVSIPVGASLAIIGPNGAGKTALFRALLGALPVEGTIRWKPGTRIGYVPQQLDLARDLPITGMDFLRAKPGADAVGGAGLAAALADVGVSMSTADLPIGALSGGQFQRLLLAFALLGSPNVLLLDEPTAGVDEAGEERLNELVQRLHRNRRLTVLLISHDLSVVHRQATHVLCLSRHRMCFGPPRKILTTELLTSVYGGDVGFHVHEH